MLPHDLEAEQVEAVCRVLRRYIRVRAAYLARKTVRHLADQSAYVLAVVCHPSANLDAGADARLAASLTDDLPLHVAVVVLSRATDPIRHRMLSHPAALIYGSDPRSPLAG